MLSDLRPATADLTATPAALRNRLSSTPSPPNNYRDANSWSSSGLEVPSSPSLPSPGAVLENVTGGRSSGSLNYDDDDDDDDVENQGENSDRRGSNASYLGDGRLKRPKQGIRKSICLLEENRANLRKGLTHESQNLQQKQREKDRPRAAKQTALKGAVKKPMSSTTGVSHGKKGLKDIEVGNALPVTKAQDDKAESPLPQQSSLASSPPPLQGHGTPGISTIGTTAAPVTTSPERNVPLAKATTRRREWTPPKPSGQTSIIGSSAPCVIDLVHDSDSDREIEEYDEGRLNDDARTADNLQRDRSLIDKNDHSANAAFVAPKKSGPSSFFSHFHYANQNSSQKSNFAGSGGTGTMSAMDRSQSRSQSLLGRERVPSSASAPSSHGRPNVLDFITNKRRVDLVSLTNGASKEADNNEDNSGRTIPGSSRSSNANRKAKPQSRSASTITGHAMAGYAGNNTSDAGEKTSVRNPTLEYFMRGAKKGTERLHDTRDNARSKNIGNKGKGKSAKNSRSSVAVPSVAAPLDAFHALDNQEWMFGTSSQLAKADVGRGQQTQVGKGTYSRTARTVSSRQRSTSASGSEDEKRRRSPSLSDWDFDVEYATSKFMGTNSRQRKRSGKEQAHTETQTNSTSNSSRNISRWSSTSGLSRFSDSSRGLWSAGARDETGNLLDAEVVDLTSPSAAKKIVSKAEKRGEEKEASQTPPISDGNGDDNDQIIGSSNNRSNSQLDTAVPKHDSHGLRDTDGRDTNGSASELTADSNDGIPCFKALSTNELSNKISSYGFKPIKNRDKMIEVLEQCWRSMHRSVKEPNKQDRDSQDVTENVNDPTSGHANDERDDECSGATLKKTTCQEKYLHPEQRRARASREKEASLPATKARAATSTSQSSHRSHEKECASATASTATTTVALHPCSKIPRDTSKFDDRGHANVAADAGDEDNAEFPDLSSQVSKAIKAQKRRNAPDGPGQAASPTWHEKMLMYDPISLADLTAWLNTCGLGLVDEDREVGVAFVRDWCEGRGICCFGEK